MAQYTFDTMRQLLTRKNEKAMFPRSKERTIEAAKVLTLFTTPVTVLPAVAFHTYVLDKVWLRKPAGVAYAGGNAFQLRYKDATGQVIEQVASASLLNSTSETGFILVGMYDGAAVYREIDSVNANIIGQPVVACIPTANPTLGDQPIHMVLEYQLIPARFQIYP